MRISTRFISIFAGLCSLTVGGLSAAPIPGLFNTGVGPTGTPLATGAVDPHYTLIQSADPASPGPAAIVVNDALFPIVTGPWLASSAQSKWIAPKADQSGGSAAGDYTYRLTFDLTGLEPSTAVITGRWTSDNAGTALLINGASTGITYDGNFAAFSGVWTINSGFVEGLNTLDFQINNASAAANPTAFRAEVSGTAELQPPPGTPPTIVSSPTNQTVGVGGSVVLRVSATGSRPFAYQWRFNGTPIPDATNATLALNGITSANAGDYDAVVSNPFGAPISDAATVTVVFLSPAQLSYEPAGPSTRRSGVTFSEIMYHPTNRTDLRNGEFIELYNSNPFAEDLSGYRISGAVDYTFAEGVSIPALGYLVVAPVPADVMAIHGISGVLGGMTNNLPNDSGTLRLRKKSSGLILEVNYSDQNPWPVAADGSGHSLVLARPSYGENDPQAWAASNVKGGSPGVADAVPAGDLENVVINEILAHTDLPLVDYIELHNHSPLTVDVSGAWLSDAPETNKFQIPPGTLLPPGGFVVFDETELGFPLSASGETLFFVNPAQTRVIEALRYEGQANGVAFGRWPDGASGFQELALNTPGTTNAPPLARPIVINEIMYNPISGEADDQFVELYNRGLTPVNLGGWRFVAGINFTFPTNTMLAPGGYLAVAKNAGQMLTNYTGLNAANLVGNFGGSLANSGERLALAMPDSSLQINTQTMVVTTNYFYVVVDEVTYGDGGRWGQWSDGGGSSLELADAHSDNRLGPNWADSDETAKSQWTTIEHTGVLDLGHPSITSIDQMHLFLLGAGEALVDDVETISSGLNRVANPGFESDTNGWIFRGTHRPSRLATSGALSGANALRLVATSRGDVVNKVQVPLTATLAANSTATLRAKARWLRGHPELLLRVVGNSLEAVGKLPVPRNLGTPGAVNSRALANTGPAILEVTHRPVLPQAGESIRVTARPQDVDGVQTVTLIYRVDPGATLNSVPMNDTGVNGDLLPGDGIYTGMIPGQSGGVVVAFHVQATDKFAPDSTTQFPSDAPARECLVRVGESVPAGAFATYRIWMTQATFNFWSAREQSSNEDVDVTFAYGNARVVYNVGVHYGSSENYSTILTTPTGTLVGYNMTFPSDDRLLGASGVRLDWPNRDTTQLREVTMYWLLDQFGLPNHYRRFIHLHVNGVRRGTIYNDTQRPNSDSVEEWYPDDSEGELFKLNPWYEANANGSINAGTFVPPRLVNTTTTGGATKTAYYRFAWLPRATQGSASNYTNLFEMIAAANAASNGYPLAIECTVDIPNWMRTFAMNDLASYWDAFGNPNSKNSYMYRPERSGWKIMSWDFDVGLGTGNGGAQVQERPTAPLFDTSDPGLLRMNSTPFIVREYWAALDEAVFSFFQASSVQTFLADRYAAFQANGIDTVSPFVPSGTVPTGEPQRSIPDWITARRTFLLTQLNTVSNIFNVTSTNFSTTSSNLLILTGTAPVRVDRILVNTNEYAVTWLTVNTWRMLIPVTAGDTTLELTGLDRLGRPVPGAARLVTVNYVGPEVPAEGNVVINEIMYNPAVPEASFVEIHNRSASAAFDLSGWRLNGVDFTFPPGTVLTNGGFLVIAKDLVAFAAVYGYNIPLLGKFDGQLDDGGETLTLLQPGATATNDVVVDIVTYDDDPPWPAAADGQGASLQLLDAAQDNNRASNWGDGAGWKFFSYTGAVGSSGLTRLSFYFESAGGEAYVDDMSLVIGSTAGVGVNVLSNPGFESALTPPWQRGPLAVNTMITNTVAHSGNASLRFVVNPGTIALTTFYQDFPALTAGSTYTLSYWYLPVSGTNLNTRLNTVFRTVNDTRIVRATPGAPNTPLLTLPPYPSLWLSEIAPDNVSGATDNFNEPEPWIELYNGGATPLSLEGYFLANAYTNLLQWPFPAGTMLNPGEYLLVWADAETDEMLGTNLHASFRLNASTGSVLLARSLEGAPQVLDSINYSGIGTNRSYGSHPPGQLSRRQLFYFPTPGGSNDPSAPPVTLFINEWMAANTSFLRDPADQDYDDWFEIYNPTTNRVDLGGFRLTDDVLAPEKFTVPTGTTVPPGGFLLVWADEETGQTQTNGDLHVNFKLSQSGERIALYDQAGRLIDSVVFIAQTNNVSEGRWPDGGAQRFFMATPTPRFSNVIPMIEPPLSPLVSIALEAGPGVVLTWSAQSGRTYRVQFKQNLDDVAWSNLPGDVTAAGPSVTKLDTNGDTQRFYRVVVLE